MNPSIELWMRGKSRYAALCLVFVASACGCQSPAERVPATPAPQATAAQIRSAPSPSFEALLARRKEEDARTVARALVPEGSAKTHRDALGLPHWTLKIRNTSAKALPYVEMKYACFDKSGAQVDTAVANITDLQPGRVWSSEIVCTRRDAVEVKPIQLNGHPL